MLERIKSVVAATTAVVLSGTVASAGGLSDAIVEAPVIVEDPVEAAPAGGSVPGWVIPVAIVALLIGVASSSDDDDGKKVIVPEPS